MTKTYTLKDALSIVIKNGQLFENGHETEISDFEFDSLVKLIQTAIPEFDYRTFVKYESDSVEAKHSISFRDFEKNFEIGEYDTEDKFNELKDKYVVTPKFDGSSIVVYISDGKISNILSKSDKEYGFVNTKKLGNKATDEVLSKLDNSNGVVAVCCEAVCNTENNGRASANGLINSKYCQEQVDNILHLIPWDVVYGDGNRQPYLGNEITSYDIFTKIRDTGHYVTEYGVIPCDGVVCYPRDPNNKKLFIVKIYCLEVQESKVTNVTWDPSDYGLLHPVAEFDTLTFSDGRQVSRANMSNLDLIMDRKICPGSTISVGLAGNAIPTYIETTDYSDEEINKYYKTVDDKYINIKCPHCSSPTIRLGDTSELICTDHSCTWWERTFTTRLLSLLFKDDSDKLNYMISQMVMENDIKLILDPVLSELGMSNTNIVSLIMKSPNNLFEMVPIQRVSDKKWGMILSDFEKGSNALKAIEDNLSEKQWEYMQQVLVRLYSYLDKYIVKSTSEPASVQMQSL